MADGGDGEVAVVGSGLVGVCSALHLARTGNRVVLIDPGPPERAASFGNAGQLAIGEVVPLSVPGVLRQVPGWLMDPGGPLAIRWRYLPRLAPWLIRFLRHASMERVEAISRTMAALNGMIYGDYAPLLTAAGVADMVVRKPYVRVYRQEADWRAEGWRFELRVKSGLEHRTLDAEALRALLPEISDRFRFAVTYEDRHYVKSPQRLVRALREQLARSGGRLARGEVQGFDIADGAVRALRLTDGTRVAVRAAVIAAGAWSHRLARELGDSVPLESERGYHVMLRDPGVRLEHTVSNFARGMSVVPMEEGLRMCGGVEFGGLEAPPTPARFDQLIQSAREMFPGLKVEGGTRWMGHRPSLPDSLPLIDRALRFPNVVYAFGHGHMGLSWAPTTGRFVASLVNRQPINFDLAPFRLARFA
jgi:D-amino-acid dehydrogenase